ncbi:hypothetical protein KKE45_04220, partial [Patescibacteria group bacterium]|nr:hypothetical protein [Patescibacteria group bacterium]
MIFITVGTTKYPFNRLAKAINNYAKKNPQQKFTIQSGYTNHFQNYSNTTIKKFFDFNKTINLIKKAQFIISQAGEGNIFSILQFAKNPPIIIPRNPKYKEHVDNQQIHTCQILKKRKLANIVNNPQKLENIIINYKNKIKKL